MRVFGCIWFIILSLLLFEKKALFVEGMLFFSFGILWLFLYPVYQRWLYVRHYTRDIKEHYNPNKLTNITLDIADTHLQLNDQMGVSNVNTNSISSLSELPTAFYIHFADINQTLIIPKREIPDISQLKNRLQQLAETLNIDYNHYVDWEWK